MAQSGREAISATELIKHALHGTSPLVTITVKVGGVSQTQQDYDATALATAKVKELREKFELWILQTPEVHEQVVDAYDNTINHSVAPVFSGEYLTLPGMSNDVRRYPHRLRAIAKVLQDGGGMLAHGVGSGKTFSLICIAMEMRRLGRANKPMCVVQKATIGQFARSFRQAYPNAKVLVATEKTFEAKNRARFFARIATGDWDAVIVTQPQMDRIRMSNAAQTSYFSAMVEELEAVKRSAADEGEKVKERDVQNAIRGLQAKLDKLKEDLGKNGDDAVDFEQLGVDALLIDEAHAYKRLPIMTNMKNVKGIPTGDSQRAMNLDMCRQHIHGRTGGKNIVLATGTPITNTMAEAFIMLKLSSPHVLQHYRIHNFDDFATSFGRMEEKVEQTPGGSYKLVARFNKFTNGRSLTTMIRSGFDVAMGNAELGLKVPPLKGGKPMIVVTEPTELQAHFNRWMAEIEGQERSVIHTHRRHAGGSSRSARPSPSLPRS
jgi:N12 class adenine-specific DNA methylase